MDSNKISNIKWQENVIIADGDYIDSVAFNLIVNFERMIGRHIPQADMAQWVEFVALDGGLQPLKGERQKQETQVILIHDKANTELNNFNPGVYDTELSAQAFKGDLGEFTFNSIPADESLDGYTKVDILKDILLTVANEPDVRRIMFIPNLDKADSLMAYVPTLQRIDRERQDIRLTAFAMQPLGSVPCRQEILGYSLMAALGINADEIK